MMRVGRFQWPTNRISDRQTLKANNRDEELDMSLQKHLFLLAILAVAVSPAVGQVTPTAAPAKSAAQSSIPDLSGIWRHGNLPWFIPPASGPGPVTNLSRERGSGVSNYSELVGDYNNPILQPWAAEVV